MLSVMDLFLLPESVSHWDNLEEPMTLVSLEVKLWNKQSYLEVTNSDGFKFAVSNIFLFYFKGLINRDNLEDVGKLGLTFKMKFYSIKDHEGVRFVPINWVNCSPFGWFKKVGNYPEDDCELLKGATNDINSLQALLARFYGDGKSIHRINSTHSLTNPVWVRGPFGYEI